MDTQNPTPRPALALATVRSDSVATLDEVYEPHMLSPLKETHQQTDVETEGEVEVEVTETATTRTLPAKSSQFSDSTASLVDNSNAEAAGAEGENGGTRSLRRSDLSAGSSTSLAANVQGKLMEQLVDMAEENKKLRNLLEDVQGKMEKQSVVAREVVRSLQGKLARAEEKARVAAKQAELRSKGSSIEEPAQVEALRTELAAAETKANSLQESLIAKEQESKSLKTEASFLQAKVSDLSSQLERSERAHGVLKREISIMQDGSEALEHDLEMERERNQDLQIKVEAISAAANATQQRCASLESQLTETRSELDVQRQALEAKDVALREAEVKTTHFAERLLDAESAKIKLAEQLEQLESSKYQLEQEQQKASNSLNTELAQVKQLLEISKSALKQSQTDLASTASELEVERKRTAGLVADVTSLSQALRASEEQILILEQRNQSEMTDAREALVQGQSDLMNATKVMEDMLESQNAEMARRESELLAKETELLKQEADLTLLRGSISDRTEELEARLGMVVPELTAAETRIEELKLQHEQAITDNAHLVASLRVIIQQRDDKIASLEEQVAVLHEAVALRVSELEASRREHEAVVATKDALISRGLEDKAKLEEALKGVETRAQQTEDGGARRLGELVGEIESWKKVVKELEEKVQAVHKAAAEEKRRTDLILQNMEAELEMAQGETATRSEELEAEIDELKLELVDKQTEMDKLVAQVDSRLLKILAGYRDPHKLLGSPANGGHWAPDHLSPKCTGCSAAFNVAFRRHHCRKCGQVFCSDHASKSARLSLWTRMPDSSAPEARVCDGCYRDLQ